MALGFRDIPGGFSVVGEFAQVGRRQGHRPRRPGQSGCRCHAPKKPKPCSKRGASAVIFWRGGTLFLLGFWRKRVVGRGFLVVNLWWIAGESWEVDGQFSGSKNMPLFLNLFLRDSHFGNAGSSPSSEDLRAKRRSEPEPSWLPDPKEQWSGPPCPCNLPGDLGQAGVSLAAVFIAAADGDHPVRFATPHP